VRFRCVLQAAMPPRTPTPLITVDLSKRPHEQEKPLHNRLAPGCAPACRPTHSCKANWRQSDPRIHAAASEGSPVATQVAPRHPSGG
jgi:hypothetical protein